MQPLSLLHLADVHLGLGSTGAHGNEERAFSAAVDLARERLVDVVVIAGDLFDHPRVTDELLDWTAQELNRLERPCVLLPGNHDTVGPESVHERFQAAVRCPQVLVLEDPVGAVRVVPGLPLAVWGRAMTAHVPSFRPLAGIPPKPEGVWAVALGHGHPLLRDKPSHHASPISPADVEAVDWDYLALGHHHAFRVLRDAPRPAVYPGALARSRRGEPGLVHVHLDPASGVTFEWAPLPLPVLA